MIYSDKALERLFRTDSQGRTVYLGNGALTRGLIIDDEQKAEIEATYRKFKEVYMPWRMRWLIPMLVILPAFFVVTQIVSPSSPYFDSMVIVFFVIMGAILLFGTIVELKILADPLSKRIRQISKNAQKVGRTGIYEWGRIVGASLRPWFAVTLGVLGLIPLVPGILLILKWPVLGLITTALFLLFGSWYLVFVKSSFIAARQEPESK
ncbi:MAG: hypothetical protein IH945_00380 [Armatimonadetes bacterium]|nr:hypothetical protein [Armatimonadota bacterium]